eukprot:m.464967 g.464967  ORF g.464967 m.464967 type:complete len:396 (-) comp23905_c0_seq1:167-1354(-)
MEVDNKDITVWSSCNTTGEPEPGLQSTAISVSFLARPCENKNRRRSLVPRNSCSTRSTSRIVGGAILHSGVGLLLEKGLPVLTTGSGGHRLEHHACQFFVVVGDTPRGGAGICPALVGVCTAVDQQSDHIRVATADCDVERGGSGAFRREVDIRAAIKQHGCHIDVAQLRRLPKRTGTVCCRHLVGVSQMLEQQLHHLDFGACRRGVQWSFAGACLCQVDTGTATEQQVYQVSAAGLRCTPQRSCAVFDCVVGIGEAAVDQNRCQVAVSILHRHKQRSDAVMTARMRGVGTSLEQGKSPVAVTGIHSLEQQFRELLDVHGLFVPFVGLRVQLFCPALVIHVIHPQRAIAKVVEISWIHVTAKAQNFVDLEPAAIHRPREHADLLAHVHSYSMGAE